MATSPLAIHANRANAQLSTGPLTPQGKLASSGNARSHGLTATQALLPTEDPEEYARHHQAYEEHYRPADPIAQAQLNELVGLRWRLRRVPTFEVQLLTLEIHSLSINPEFENLPENHIAGLAFSRLVQSKVLTNLYHQEARLARRAEKLERQLKASEPALAPAPAPTPKPEIKIQKIEPISKPTPIRVLPQPGRNEPCPCASGLKFKRCCLNKPQPGRASATA